MKENAEFFEVNQEAQRFNPFDEDLFNGFLESDISNLKIQGFDAKDIRNEAVKGLNFATNGGFFDFLEKHQNDEVLQDLIELNCNMSVDEALEQGQKELVQKGETTLVQNIIASCNMCYSQKCEEVADYLDSMQRHTEQIKQRTRKHR